jgi:hypothetical protein
MPKAPFLFLLALVFCIRASGQMQYVFYLHGAIVEGTTSDPISESYGRYEYSKIIAALRQYGYTVMSEVRQANTIPDVYALKIAGQVDSLKKAGVETRNITVIGASKGALIAMLVSGYVKDKEVKYVLMAGCSASSARYPVDLYGKILSIYEKSDPGAGSCNTIKKSSNGIKKYKEIELTTGKQHGFIYRPLEEWIVPVTAWISN